MKFAISNIAWKPHENEAAYSLIQEYGFTGLEIAPSLFMAGSQVPYDESKERCLVEKENAQKYGLELVSMQSLLFGSAGLSLFNDIISQKNLLNYCKKAVDFASFLEIPNLVFGSPKNRIIPKGLSQIDAEAIAISFFRELGNYAKNKNTCIAIEANAADYGGNFITKTTQAVELIRKINCDGFKLNLDMGTMSLGHENADIINSAMPHINHIHISEGFLKPIYTGNVETHKKRAKKIKFFTYNGYLSIEMKSISEQNNLDHIKSALKFVRNHYM